MSKFKSILIAGAAIFALGSTASAFENNIVNRLQQNLGVVFSELRLYTGWVGGDLRGTSIAIGNNFAATAAGPTYYLNRQIQLADVGATLKASIKGVGGDVDLSAVGICNNAALNVSTGYASAHNDQRCMTTDPYALVNVNIGTVVGDTNVAGTAIANNWSVNVQGTNLEVGNWLQNNAANTYANVTANIGQTVGDVSVTAAAIGNNVGITHGF